MATKAGEQFMFNLSQFDPSARDLRNGAHEWVQPLLPAILLDPATGGERIQDHPGSQWIPDGPLLDRLFASEKLQLTKLFAGLRTWEAKVLSQPEAYTPAGTTDGNQGIEASPLFWFDLDSITVNENTWLTCLRRDRWTDFERPISGWPGKFWRASDDQVWALLRPVLELANRIIVATTSHYWLGSLLHPDSIEFIRDIFLCNGKKYDMQRFRVMARENRVTGAEGMRTIDAALRDRLLWALHDEHHSIAVGRAVAYCFHVDEHTAWASLDVRLLREIFDRSMNEGLSPERRRIKRAMAAYHAAVVLVHEFMHAVTTPVARAALLKGPIPPEVTERYRRNMREPFFEKEWMCEAGASYSHHVFGTSPDSSLDLHDWLVILTGQPFPTNYMNQNGLTYGIDAPRLWPRKIRDFCRPQPTLWSNAHLSEAFWTSRVGKYGASGLMVPGLLVTQVFHYSIPGGTSWYHAFDPARPIAATLHSKVPREIEGSFQRLLTSLEARRRLWSQWRSPWYDEAYAKWKFSPHSIAPYREMFQDGVAALFQARDLRAASTLFGKALSFVRPYPYPAASEDENAWPLAFWRVLGFLIMAAIPHYTHPMTFQYPTPGYPNVWKSTHPDKEERSFQTEQIEYSHVFFQNIVKQENPPAVYEVGITREECFAQAARQAEWYAASCPVPLPRSCELAIGALWTRLRAQAAQKPDGEWLDFEFQLPPFDPCEIQDGVAEAKLHWRGVHGTPPASPLDVNMREAPALSALAAVVVSESLEEPRRRMGTRYFTWGEVGDHQPGKESGDWWVVKENGDDEFDVYDVSDVVRELHLSDATVKRSVARRTGRPHMSLRLLSEDTELSTVSKELAGMIRGLRPIGRTLKYARREDVTLRDGLDGRPAWTIIGGDVFDITDFDFFEGEQKLRELLLKHAGGTAVLALQAEGHECVEVAELLAPCRNRVLQPVVPSHSVVNDVFTAEEVAAMGLDETALYIIIHDGVYSLRDYVDFHPGGANILREVAFRDATEKFMQYHGHEEDEVLKQIRHFRVGRIVKSWTAESLTSTEILIMQNVYDIGRLSGDELEQKLRDNLEAYAGSDATEELRKRRRDASARLDLDTGHPLFQLSRRKDLVVGRVLEERNETPTDPIVASVCNTPTLPALFTQPLSQMDRGRQEWDHDVPISDDLEDARDATIGPVEKLNTTITKQDVQSLLLRGELESKRALEKVVLGGTDVVESDSWDEARRRERKRAGSELDLIDEMEVRRARRRRGIEEGLNRLGEVKPGFFGNVFAPSCK
ncbi:hypothetical protein SODALDRAFT_326102 [Sodiomyces alkalinus F11]|uniref:Cytochrome b5 heme-binding domain-containing protein n=1 Tax=Sodiomyces alkalinus (strain CBS 110278 / VKM F-3762 / F11) TaxID=1314773 RepID=A0A3N2Q566_SODAK|nr:hypothetical protein SODALDRAFT_326102 [Sodiomyces alkalinus F11]ROT41919.1 hypothetical protein SODALDRAFT_326102 [Sodiomyces alkalinus F11]